MTAAQLSVVVATVAFAGLAVLNAFLDGPGALTAALAAFGGLGFLTILGMLAADARRPLSDLPPPDLP